LGVEDKSLLSSTTSGERVSLIATGAWTARNAGRLDEIIAKLPRPVGSHSQSILDMRGVNELDTYGAGLVQQLVQGWCEGGDTIEVVGLAERFVELASAVRQATHAPETRTTVENPLRTWVEGVGHSVSDLGDDLKGMLNMLGAVGYALLGAVRNPLTFRLTSTVHHVDRVAWQAVPIILLMTFLIGCIISQQGFFHFRKFGADQYVVDMIGILVVREIGVLLVAIMVAGRSGSSYTAELGSMSALYGGGVVAWAYGGMSSDIYIARLQEAITLDHFKVGMIKAPFMALVIGIVACLEGLKVRGSAESLGLQTTASVVKSIFLVIVLDGLFAMYFSSIGI
jgi:phospholipid/cholesterol/gamma-HCH transport system permease protein